ncbi:hypothetical protein I4U23_029292 [Adineta vaga]|nr:hypothetical protein I4U23_029292 [Adineta vaga]
MKIRTRNPAISGVGLHNQNYTHKVGHSCIVCGCLSIVIGLILIIVGVISEIKKTTFIGAGVIGLGVGCFLMTLVCFYAKLDICYNNWAYRSRVLPANSEIPQSAPPGIKTRSPFVKIEKQQTSTSPKTLVPSTVASEIEVHKIVHDTSRQIDSIAIHADNIP